MPEYLPPLLSSYAIGVTDRPPEDWSDGDLPRGTHLRVVPGEGAGYPLAPLLMWPVPVQTWDIDEPLQYLALDGAKVAGAQLSPIDPRQPIIARIVGTGRMRDGLVLGIEALPAGGGDGRVRRVRLIAPSNGRVASARSAKPFRVAAPLVQQIEVLADGPFTLRVFYALRESLVQIPAPADAVAMSGPASGAWHVTDPRSDPMKRVRDGAPRRPSPVDEPDGPRLPFAQPEDEETQRLNELLDGPTRDFGRMVTAADRRDDVSVPADPAAPLHASSYNPMDALLLQSLDPGLARWLGLMAVLGPPGADLGSVQAWVAAGLFAVETPASPMPENPALRARLADEMHQLRDAQGAAGPVGRAEALGLAVRVLGTVCLVAPPPDVPSGFAVQAGRADWLLQDDAFEQRFLLPTPPVAPLVALARAQGGPFEPRNGLAVPGGRRQRPLALGTCTPLQRGIASTGLVFDGEVAATGQPWHYRVALGDLFGRFGPATEIVVNEPDRPGVPQPTFTASVLVEGVAAGSGPASAGVVLVELNVPARAQLPAGSLPLARARASLDTGGQQDVALDPAGGDQQLRLPLELPPTVPAPQPGCTRTVVATVTLEDSAGRTCSRTCTLQVTDPRLPSLPAAATGLVWTSRPSSAAEVELALAFDAPTGSLWRAYLTDANTLLGAAAAGPRADQADAGVRAPGAGLRDGFRRLDDSPREAADGRLLFAAGLPRSLRAVQFLRFVPVNDRGLEGDFAASPLVPVAVPDDLPPPPPRIEIEGDDEGRVRLRIVAEGLNLGLLQVTEPGLFGGAAAGDVRSPEFRVRRALGAVPDPVRARLLRTPAGPMSEPGALALEPQRAGPAAPTVFAGHCVDARSEYYGRYVYWAEVRMPAERRFKRGVPQDLPARRMRGVSAVQEQDAPGIWSEASAAVVTCPVPARIPALTVAQADATVQQLGGTWQVTFTVVDGPRTPVSAAAAFHVRWYASWATLGELSFIEQVALVDGACSLVRDWPGGMPAEVKVAAVLVDPVGREGEPLWMTATAVA